MIMRTKRVLTILLLLDIVALISCATCAFKYESSGLFGICIILAAICLAFVSALDNLKQEV